MKDIELALGRDFNSVVADLYVNHQMAGIEISDHIYRTTGIRITQRSILRQLKVLGVIRNFSDAFQLAIKKGRKEYSHLKKSVKSSAHRMGISLRVRSEILMREKFTCVLCGASAPDTILVIDHLRAVVHGGTSDPKNLPALYRECNHGKMLSEERYD